MTAPTRPAGDGEWRQTYGPSIWDILICSVRGHELIEQEHDHDGYGSEDVRRCNRCQSVWVRDGCVVRQCGGRVGGA